MIEIAQQDGVSVAQVTVPRLDAAEAPAFRAAVAPLSAPGGQVVLDLARVEFVDSTGLGAIVSLMKAVGPTGGFALANARPPVRRLFELTRLDRVFSLHGAVDDALAALQA
jgi:anti-sigma B factor antagonist